MADTAVASAKTVLLGGREFTVRTVPVARVKLIVPVLTELFKELTKDQDKSQNATGVAADGASSQESGEAQSVGIEAVVDKLLQTPHRFLGLFINNLPESVFTDPDNGATLPEILKALEVVMDLNRLDVIKNVFSRLSMEWLKGMQAQARQLISKN